MPGERRPVLYCNPTHHNPTASGSFVRPPRRDARSRTHPAATVWSASLLLTEIATQWIEDGTARAIRDARRGEAAARQAIAASMLKGHRYRSHPTAYFIWMPIPDPWSDRHVCRARGSIHALGARTRGALERA
jgi:DNA-binding transcriptional MocR family regulator